MDSQDTAQKIDEANALKEEYETKAADLEEVMARQQSAEADKEAADNAAEEAASE